MKHIKLGHLSAEQRKQLDTLCNQLEDFCTAHGIGLVGLCTLDSDAKFDGSVEAVLKGGDMHNVHAEISMATRMLLTNTTNTHVYATANMLYGMGIAKQEYNVGDDGKVENIAKALAADAVRLFLEAPEGHSTWLGLDDNNDHRFQRDGEITKWKA